MKRIRVMITDDHAVFRNALCCLLETDPAIEVVGMTASGQQACDMAQDTQPQVICMDCMMGAMDGIETTRQLMRAMPHMKIIGLSAGCDDGTEAAMLAAGACRYIDKANICNDLLPAIHALLQVAVTAGAQAGTGTPSCTAGS